MMKLSINNLYFTYNRKNILAKVFSKVLDLLNWLVGFQVKKILWYKFTTIANSQFSLSFRLWLGFYAYSVSPAKLVSSQVFTLVFLASSLYRFPSFRFLNPSCKLETGQPTGFSSNKEVVSFS